MTAEPIHPSNEALIYARDYASRGWRVLPIKPGEKRPPMSAWQNAATSNEATIENWFTGLYADHGVGIATGGRLFALDVDVSGDKQGDESLADLELRYGRLPETATVLTGSGGQHRYFLAPEGVTIRNNASTTLGPGLDIRGEGGQCVAPPTIHPNGNAYEWDGGDVGTVADAPAWLIRLLAEKPKPDTPSEPKATTSDSDSVAARYNDQTTWAQLLSDDGWTLAQTMPDGEQRWVRPGKEAREGISATVGHGGGGQMTVFSSSIAWLPEGSYSRFGYYACRHHGGDRSAAASHLYALDMAPVNALLESVPITDITHDVMADVLSEDDHGWTTTDLSAVLSAGYEPIKPTKLARADGPCLFYDERINAVYGESGSGKSWVAMALCAEEINAGRHVVYFDLEDHAGSMAHRMMSLGVSAEDLIERFHYVSPTGPWGTHASTHWVAQVQLLNISVCVVDSTGEALSVDGKNPDKDPEVADWFRKMPRKIARAGACVVLIDHVPKSDEASKRFAIGSQRKLAAVDGAAYRVDVRVAPAKGVEGFLGLSVAKDRHGNYQHGSKVADVAINDDSGRVVVTIKPPDAGLPTVLMTRISHYLMEQGSSSARQIESGIDGSTKAKRFALNQLVDLGYVDRFTRTGKGGGFEFRFVKVFDEADLWVTDSSVENPNRANRAEPRLTQGGAVTELTVPTAPTTRYEVGVEARLGAGEGTPQNLSAPNQLGAVSDHLKPTGTDNLPDLF